MLERSLTWQRCGAWTGGTVAALAISPHVTQDGVVLAATAAGLYRSIDGGQQWVSCQNGLSDPRIATVVFAPAAPTVTPTALPVAFAATADGRLFQRQDTGATWQEITAWAGLGLINAIAVSPNFALDQTLFVATVEGVFRSQDGGRTWESSTFGLLDLEILCLACAPTFAESDLLWAGSALGGLYRSRNAARSWRESGQGLPDLAMQCIAASPTFAQDQTLYVGTEGDGIYTSTDGGANWQPLSPHLAGQSVNCLAISVDGQTLLAGTGDGVYRSVDGGRQWALTTDGAFVALTVALAPDGTAVAGAYQEGVLRLAAEADAWQPASLGLTAHAPPLVLRDQQNSLYLLDVEGAFVYSKDGGRTWQSLNRAMAEEPVLAVALAADATDASLFAVTEQTLYRAQTPATASSWRSWPLPESDARSMLLACSPLFPVTLMLAAENGNLYCSTNGGEAWQPLVVPWRGSRLVRLHFSPVDRSQQTLYALTVQPTADGNYLLQVWQTTDGGDTWLMLADFYGDTPVAAMTLPHDPVEQPIFLGVRNRLIRLYRNAADLTWAVSQQFLEETHRITDIVTTEKYIEDKLLYVTTNDGLYATTDAGVTWTPVAAELTGRNMAAFLPGAAELPTYAVELGGVIWQQ